VTEPASKEEYEKKIQEGTSISDSGMGTTMSVPCPFCGEPHFMSWKILEVNDALQKGSVCRFCERGMRGLVVPLEHGGVRVTLYQTSGSDPSAWVPRLPRLPGYAKQSSEWQEIRDELVKEWEEGGKLPYEAPCSNDVTREQKKRMLARGERYMEYDDIMAELRANGGAFIPDESWPRMGKK
jgi:hypothetical protein